MKAKYNQLAEEHKASLLDIAHHHEKDVHVYKVLGETQIKALETEFRLIEAEAQLRILRRANPV